LVQLQSLSQVAVVEAVVLVWHLTQRPLQIQTQQHQIHQQH
tara:strand:- start:135 stop:257 length:123 start_codon:yes stop_codon:yes gene_type:complete